jgi:hypothetical protein
MAAGLWFWLIYVICVLFGLLGGLASGQELPASGEPAGGVRAARPARLGCIWCAVEIAAATHRHTIRPSLSMLCLDTKRMPTEITSACTLQWNMASISPSRRVIPSSSDMTPSASTTL